MGRAPRRAAGGRGRRAERVRARHRRRRLPPARRIGSSSLPTACLGPAASCRRRPPSSVPRYRLPGRVHRVPGHHLPAQEPRACWSRPWRGSRRRQPDLRLVLLGGVGPAEAELRSSITLDRAAATASCARAASPTPTATGSTRWPQRLVFPSRYEGFGAPGARGDGRRAAGVAADAAALPEVVARRRAARRPGRRRGLGGGRRPSCSTTRPRADLLRAAGRARAAGVHGGRARRRPSSTPTVCALAMKLAVLCPHFAPDLAPTGEVITRIVLELADRGHELHVVTALPWYVHHHVEPAWAGPARPRRAHRVGLDRPRPPVPDRQAVDPAPGRRLRRASARWPGSPACAAGGSTACSPCRRRSRSG